MPRLEADYRITIRSNKTGRLHKVELINVPFTKRYRIRYNGLNSKKHQNGLTISAITVELRKLLTERE